MNKSIIITVVIPVKNGAKTIRTCLDAIQSQTLFAETEVIVIDSGSTDGTLDILAEYPFIRLFQIPPEEFGHGKTRNYGVSLAKGRFVVMTVQDARAADDRWLEKMLKHFHDEKVVAVVGQQVVPHEKDKNPHQWWRPVSKPRVIETYFDNPNDFLALPGEEQDAVCFYDNVNTMYRKSALLEIPFADVSFGEDMVIIKAFLSSRKKVVYDANSSVWHYHFLSYDYKYRIDMTVFYHKLKVFGYFDYKKVRIIDYLLIIYRNVKNRFPIHWMFHNIQILRAKNKANKKFRQLYRNDTVDLDAYFKAYFKETVQGIQNTSSKSKIPNLFSNDG